MALTRIAKIVEAAATLYQNGLPFRDAVAQALTQEGVSDHDRIPLYREACRRLGSRGGKRNAKLAARKPQMSIRFPRTKTVAE